jgi:hypothetical protein
VLAHLSETGKLTREGERPPPQRRGEMSIDTSLAYMLYSDIAYTLAIQKPINGEYNI